MLTSALNVISFLLVFHFFHSNFEEQYLCRTYMDASGQIKLLIITLHSKNKIHRSYGTGCKTEKLLTFKLLINKLMMETMLTIKIGIG